MFSHIRMFHVVMLTTVLIAIATFAAVSPWNGGFGFFSANVAASNEEVTKVSADDELRAAKLRSLQEYVAAIKESGRGVDSPEYAAIDPSIWTAINDLQPTLRFGLQPEINQNFAGTLTTADPVFNRPFDCTGLSGVGTATRHDAIQFTHSCASPITLSFETADGGSISPRGTGVAGPDTFLVLYGPGGFNPASPLTNCVAVNDDIGGGIFRSRVLSTSLPAGNYTAVITSYNNEPITTSTDNALPWTYSLAVNDTCVAGATPTPTPTPVGSPTPTPAPSPTPSPSGRVIRAGNVATLPGQTVALPIELISQGNESSASFSVNFNSTVLTYVSTALGSGVPAGSNLGLNTNQVGQGRLGILVDSTNTYAAGTRQMVVITFTAAANAPLGLYPVTFGDVPTSRSVSSAQGALLSTTYTSGSIQIGSSAAGVDVSGRVVTSDGRGIRNAAVYITNSSGTRRQANTSSFGVYRFSDVEAGQAYTISVSSKLYRFAPRVIQVTDTLTDLDFVGLQ